MASGALTGALPGAKLDGCEAKCCYTDKCNTKDIVKLPTKQPPTKMGPSAMAAYTGASIATSIVSLLAGLAVSFYWLLIYSATCMWVWLRRPLLFGTLARVFITSLYDACFVKFCVIFVKGVLINWFYNLQCFVCWVFVNTCNFRFFQ